VTIDAIRQDLEPSLVVPAGTLDRLASRVSQVTAPPVLALAAAMACARVVGAAQGHGWLALYLGLVVALPVVYLLWLLARGQVADFHLYRREDRLRPYLATLLAAALGWAILRWGGAPRLLVVLAGATCLQTATLLAVTLRWKISAHTATAAALAVLTAALAGPVAAPFAAAVPVVAWARVRLRRHTVAQTVAGALVGGLGLTLALAVAGR
jgi:hypothetical protein